MRIANGRTGPLAERPEGTFAVFQKSKNFAQSISSENAGAFEKSL
jgi:hypothetical protein